MTTALFEPLPSPPPSAVHPGRRTRRVLHLINGEHYAGAERVQDLLAQCLPEEGFEVTFACLKPAKFPEARQSRNVPLYTARMRWKFDVEPARGIVKLIRREQFALVHTHTPRSAMIGRLAALWAGVPMVHHVHGHTSSEVGAGWRHRFNAWVEKKSLAGAAKVIAVSQSSAAYMAAQGMPPERLVVVPNGIAPRRLVGRDPPDGGWTLGIVGLFRPRKGLEVLLRAVAHLRRHRHEVRLRAVGPFETPKYEAEIRRLCAELQVDDLVDWRGFQSDVAAELDAMDLFVFPSLLPEGLPMVVLEAMAAGVPVIGTTVDGVTDVLRDGRDGLLTPPGNPFELAAAAARIMVNPELWCELREAAHARQATRFSDNSMAAGVAEVYRGILGS